jgi:hypothetical protein
MANEFLANLLGINMTVLTLLLMGGTSSIFAILGYFNGTSYYSILARQLLSRFF